MKFNNSSEGQNNNEIKSIEKALSSGSKDLTFLESLVQILPSPLFYKNQYGVYKYCNKAFCDYLGLPFNAVIDHTVYDIAPINLANIYHQADLDLIQSHGTQVYESQVRFADGNLHDVVFHKTAHVSQSGEALGLIGIMLDITEQKKNERKISRQNLIKDVLIHISNTINKETEYVDFFKLFLDELVGAITSANYGTILEITNNGRLIIIASNGYNVEKAKLFDIPYKESFTYDHINGVTKEPTMISDLRPYLNSNRPPLIPTLDGRNIQSCLYIPLHLTDGRHIIVSIESASLDAFGDIDIGSAEYIQLQLPILHQIHLLNQKTLLLSRYDTLTGLMNRGYFNIILEDRIQIASRSQSKLSVIMFDLDGLKIINDNLGHAAGDCYLSHFAKFLNDHFRSTDTFARIGGDEFLGIFTTTEPQTLNKKMTLLQTLYTEIEIPFNDTFFQGRFSYGIATYPDDADTLDGLLTLADIKMYQDKKNNPT